MEKETYTSNQGLIKELDKIARTIKEKYGISVWFAEILGRRRSYIAGETEEEISFLPPTEVKVTPTLALLTHGWEKLKEGERSVILSSIREILKLHR